LGYLSQIAYLDLSKNRFGLSSSDGVVAIGEGISALTGLRTLNLLGNFLGFQDSNGLISLGQGISGLTQLQSINLSNNNLGYVDSNGTAAFGQALMGLKKLTSLAMPYNYVGFVDSLGTVSLGQGIANLDSIAFLDLSNNFLGNTDSAGTVAIGKGLLNCSLLTHLDLSDNAIGDFDALGSVAITHSIRNMKKLVHFDISYNNVDLSSSDASIALAQSLNGSQTLESVNLGNNAIGSTGPEGSQALIPVLLNLPKLKPENLNVQGMTNISWTQAASYLQNRQSQAMIEACQVSQCFGGDIHVNSGAPQSLAIDAPVTPIGNTTLAHEARALVVYDDQVGQTSSDMVSTLGVSALTGAAFAALPEAFGDALYLSGLVSDVNASRVKVVTNAALVFATGSWLPVGASMATSAVLQRAGVSEPTSRLAGNAAAFFVNAGRSLTPTGFAAMAVNYAAGKAGLFLEKYTMKRVFGKASFNY
jgi:Ran GTPase-activating protein (RanGAP) involved in mRNA processing and transport